jgi:hypothetical protein
LNKPLVVGEGGALPVDGLLLAGAVATTAAAGAAIAVNHATDAEADEEAAGAKHSTLDSETDGDLKPSFDEDIDLNPKTDRLPSEVNGDTTLALPVPAKPIQRSKSKKEIVEEALADAMGNNPQRGVTPGAWPDTPGDQLNRTQYL